MAIPTVKETHDDLTAARPRERLEHHNKRFGLDDINPRHMHSDAFLNREALAEGVTASEFDDRNGAIAQPVAEEELDGFGPGPLPPA